MRPRSPSLSASLESDTAQAEEHLSLALPYLSGRGIDRECAERFRLGVVNDPSTSYNGRLLIPYLGLGNAVYGARYRDLGGHAKAKYLGLAGVSMWLFNLRAVHEAGGEIHLTEGEIDAIILESLGFHAVAVPGASSWKRHHHRIFAGFTRVYVWGDGDKAGGGLAAKVAQSLLSAVVCKVPEKHDVNSLYLEAGREGIERAMGLIE